MVNPEHFLRFVSFNSCFPRGSGGTILKMLSMYRVLQWVVLSREIVGQ